MLNVISTSAAFSPAPSYYELKAMVIAFGVTLIILSLLLVLAIATAALLYLSELQLCIHTKLRACY